MVIFIIKYYSNKIVKNKNDHSLTCLSPLETTHRYGAHQPWRTTAPPRKGLHTLQKPFNILKKNPPLSATKSL